MTRIEQITGVTLADNDLAEQIDPYVLSFALSLGPKYTYLDT